MIGSRSFDNVNRFVPHSNVINFADESMVSFDAPSTVNGRSLAIEPVISLPPNFVIIQEDTALWGLGRLGCVHIKLILYSSPRSGFSARNSAVFAFTSVSPNTFILTH